MFCCSEVGKVIWLLQWTNPSLNIFQPEVHFNNQTVDKPKQVYNTKADGRNYMQDTVIRKCHKTTLDLIVLSRSSFNYSLVLCLELW